MAAPIQALKGLRGSDQDQAGVGNPEPFISGLVIAATMRHQKPKGIHQCLFKFSH
jgi:hypothetical protein